MNIQGSKFIQLLVYLIGLQCMEFNLSGAVRCVDSEHEALLRFKGGFKSASDRFSTWTAEEDCCKWRGVGCDDTTNHVITLDLHSHQDPSFNILQGDQISKSLLDLSYLRHLDLSHNNFQRIQIPDFIGSLHYIEYLNLSNANFRGTIPNNLGNLSHLKSLDLSGNGFSSLRADNLNWVHNLSSLEVLDLGGVDLSNAQNWLDAINMLPSLEELRLFFCMLHKLPQYLHHVNFTSLRHLDLSLNNFSSTIPDWLFDIGHSLVYLNLARCQLQGPIPDAFGNLTSLTYLDLSHNYLGGPIPLTLGLLQEESQLNRSSSLKKLYLFDNQLNGSLEQILVQLSQLVALDVSGNDLEGNITEDHLLKLKGLRVLDLSSNRLVLNVSSSWIPPFQLETIGLGSCGLGAQFPQWLRSQKIFSFINISKNSIADVVPDWFWSLSSRIVYMDLSSNELEGYVPDFSLQLQLSALNLRSNNFRSPLPRFSANLRILNLARNSFFGTISHLCGIWSLSYLDLFSNNISGEIPDCWKYEHNLVILNLANNSLSGQIPNSIGQLIHLNTLLLKKNRLSGEVPSSLRNCSGLINLQLAKNRLLGNVPAWIGENLQNLKFLSLGYNAFSGSFPLQLCQLKYMQILDLASNNLSGPIPRCIFVGMTSIDETLSIIYYPFTVYNHYTFQRVVRHYMTFLDLSSNNLWGQIPIQFMSLVGLQYLNLSGNHLDGPIPPNIGEMENLEALDLSRNQLSCTMPGSMKDLTSLAILDVSNNYLSGEIPRGNQFDTFGDLSYIGNPQLCGIQLRKTCSSNESFGDPHCSNGQGDEEKQGIQKEEHDGSEIPSFYICMGLGFITGFWVFWGSLLLNRSWRHTYFRFLGNMNDKIYVMVAVVATKLQRKFQRQQAPQVKGRY